MSERSKPTVLVLASTYPRWAGDHEPRFVHELCRRLVDRFDVVVLTSRSPGAKRAETMDGVEVRRFAYAPAALETLVYGGGMASNVRRSPWKLLLLPSFLGAMYRAARRIARTRTIDVVHAHWLIPQGLIARRLRRAAGIPFLATSHGGDLFGLRGALPMRLKRRVAEASGAMTVVSNAMRDEARRSGLQPPLLDVVPMGVDMRERFTPSDAVVRADDELLFVGRLVAKKGLPHLLDAMPLILKARPAARLTIAGFGPEEAALKARCAELGIDAAVRFAGAVRQEELPAMYRRASVLVAPFVRDATGDQEGLPVVLMEAIACGCPVVCGDVPGVNDLLGEDAAEISVDATDATRLADVVIAALDDPARARERARRLRETLGRFDWSTIATRYGELLEHCMRRGEARVGPRGATA